MKVFKLLIFIIISAALITLLTLHGRSIAVEKQPAANDMLLSTRSNPRATTATVSTTETETPITTEEPYFRGISTKDYVTLDVELVSQYPEYPSGCELISLTMLLNYYGYDISKSEIINNYLITGSNFVESYSGSVYSSGGCFAPAIVKMANKFLEDHGNKYKALDLTGTELSDLYKYLEEGSPAMVWCTIGLDYGWSTGGQTYNGKVYEFNGLEHCVVLSGYNSKDNTVTLCDPIDGVKTVSVERFEPIYDMMYQQAVVLYKQ